MTLFKLLRERLFFIHNWPRAFKEGVFFNILISVFFVFYYWKFDSNHSEMFQSNGKYPELSYLYIRAIRI